MKSNKQKRLYDSLSKNHACYVLITCDEPTDDGNMQVKMTYEGEAPLVSYLLQGAQSIFDTESQG